ncbi:hypothetical protein [Streptomyces virginiae]
MEAGPGDQHADGAVGAVQVEVEEQLRRRRRVGLREQQACGEILVSR